MDLFDRLLIQQQLDRGESKVKDAEAGVSRSLTEIEVLKIYVERLLMVSEVLWNILKEKHGYGDEDLIERITEIDLRDGKLDGRVADGATPKCPQCNRLHVARHRPVCLYCGAALTTGPFNR